MEGTGLTRRHQQTCSPAGAISRNGAVFVRQSNGVTLTPAGNLYARKVSRIVRNLRRATAEVRTPDTAVGR